MNKCTGIDISKQTFDCSITRPDGKIEVKKLSNNLKGFEALKKLLPEEAHVIMEASGPYYVKLEATMKQVAIEKYSASYKAIQTVPGIGPKSAAMLIAITGNFKKFENHKQLLAYVGLNPRIYESGTSVKGKGRISKMGTARVRKLLYLCSWSAKKANIYCKELYDRLKQNQKELLK